MDYRTKVTVTSALLGVLCLTAVLGWVFGPSAVTERQAQSALLTGFQPSEVTGLDLGNGVKLTKNTQWALGYLDKPYPASAERVDTYLKTLAGNLRERLVTNSGDVKAFGLDQGFRTLKLLGAGGKVLAELQVGASNNLGDKVYVRFAGQHDVWETDRGFARTLDQDFNTWADLSLFPGKKAADLTRISFDSRIETNDKTVYTPFDLERTLKDGKSSWSNRLTKASAENMASWADLVPTFRFGAFAGPSELPASGASLGTLTAYWSDGTQTAVKIGSPDGQNRYRASEGSRDFWINGWALAQLLYK